jgi:NDP-sugar pyrophosphorylase family protein
MPDIVGIALAGGLGVRARPLTLTSPGNVRAKAAVKLLGRPLIDWQVRALASQGVADFCVVAKGRENRFQIRDVLGYGDRHDVRVRYSRPRHDRHNVGSGESTLRHLEVWDLDGLALVFPTDSVFEFDLGAMVDAHKRSGAVLTVGSVRYPAREVAGKYGMMVRDSSGWCRRFLEKPSLPTIRTAVGGNDPLVDTNAGLYLIDCRFFRQLLATGGLVGMLSSRLDWGGDLLPWLIANGAPVLSWPIERFGDLGSPRDYLQTVQSVLSGDYPDLAKMLPAPFADDVWVHESTLHHRDPATGLTLADKVRAGLVALSAGVRIGRDVEIGTGVRIVNSDIGDSVDVGHNAVLHGVAIMDGAMIGPYARLTDTYVGTMTELASTADAPIITGAYTAIGDGVHIGRGTRLNGENIAPGTTITGCEPLSA